MLNASYMENTLFLRGAIARVAWDVKGETDVAGFANFKKLDPPALRSVVTIYYGKKDGKPAGRPAAAVFPLPDGTLIRLRIKGDNTYAYEDATVFPKDHPAILAANADPSRDPNERIEITLSDEGPASERIRADETDVARLKARLDDDHERSHRALKAAGLIP